MKGSVAVLLSQLWPAELRNCCYDSADPPLSLLGKRKGHLLVNAVMGESETGKN